MAIETRTRDAWRHSPLRMAMWSAAALLLALPWLAMRAGMDGVDWSPADFVAMGVLLALACLALEAMARTSGGAAYRLGSVLAVGAVFLLVWANLAVGLVGDEGNPANLLYVAVPAILVGGAIGGRRRATAMARTLLAAAAAQVAIGVLAIALGLGMPASGPWELAGVTAFFAVPMLLAAGLFERAARLEARRTGT